MFVRVPSTERLRLAVRWKLPHQICAGVVEPIDIYITSEAGVRMGQVVYAIRSSWKELGVRLIFVTWLKHSTTLVIAIGSEAGSDHNGSYHYCSYVAEH